MSDRWEPVPVPLGDGRHDIGDDARAAIARRLSEDFARDPELTPKKARELAIFAAASVRALLHELGTLRDMTAPADLLADATARAQEPTDYDRFKADHPQELANAEAELDREALLATHAQEKEEWQKRFDDQHAAWDRENDLRRDAEEEVTSLRQQLADKEAEWQARWEDQHAAWDRENELRRDAEAQLAQVQQELLKAKILAMPVIEEIQHPDGRIEVLRDDPATLRVPPRLRELIAKWRKRAERLPKGATYVSGFGHLTTCADELEAALVSTGSADQ